MKRWAFVYQNDLNEVSANLKQCLWTTQALAQQVDLTWLTAPFDPQKHQNVLARLGISSPPPQVSVGPELGHNGLLSEFTSRWAWSKAALSWLQAQNTEVVYTRDFGFLVFLAVQKILGKRWSFQVIYEPHKVYHRASDKVPRWVEGKALQVVDVFAPITEGIWTDLEHDFRIKKPHHIVPDGVNLPPETPYPKSDEFQMIYTGSFQSWKGLDTVLNALKGWKNKEGWKLTVCGGKPEEIALYEAQMKEAGLNDRVRFAGFLDEEALRADVARAHLALLPNNRERISARYTSPLKLFEYLGSGLPILASDLPSIREVLSEDHAWFFQPEDEGDFLKQVEFAWKDASRRKALSKGNRLYAQKFTWTERAKRIASIVPDLR
ncbi:glycosyltransferase family 4 protein [Cryomorphaceae bacterium]|nr:glycosyltransferase family 4 protein [Cryomorphaceae bacterium]